MSQKLVAPNHTKQSRLTQIRGILNHDLFWQSIVLIPLSLLLIYILLDSFFTPKWVSHYVSLIAIYGLPLTVIGSLLTYKEFQSHHQRILSYRDFYRWTETLLEEIRTQQADQFYFYGSTILPGNVSYSGEQDIKRFQGELQRLFGISTDEEDEYSKLRQAIVVVPTRSELDKNYTWFEGVRISGAARRYPDTTTWNASIRAHLKAALKLKSQLEQSDLPSRYVYTPRGARSKTLNEAYFISNGIRVVFAKPLHFVDSRASGSSPEQIVPHIVGYTTTDYNIVQAFSKHFDDVSGYSQQELLEGMYGRHLNCPINLRQLIANPLPENPVDALAVWDQDHFGNKEATDICFKLTNITQDSHVLDVGSGLGGTARYLVAHTGCRVDGIELLPDRQEYAVELNGHMPKDMQKRIRFYLGDATQMDLPKDEEKYTHVISFLSILHFQEKQQFLEWIGDVVRDGGKLYIEDYCRVNPDPTKIYETKRDDLRNVISCPNLLTETELREHLETGGFEVEAFFDMTTEWKTRVGQRCEEYKDKRTEWQIIGNDALDRAMEFAEGVKGLFDTGLIKGVRLVAKKKRLRFQNTNS